MIWFMLAIITVGAFIARRRATHYFEEEAWRESLDDGEEPLDMDEIREAEEEWLEESAWQDLEDDESWRG